MTTPAAILKRNRVRRQDVAEYAGLLATPKAGGSLTLPANGMFAVVPKTAQAASAAALTVRSGRSPSARNVGAPALAAGERHLLGMLERGAVCTPAAAYDLYLDAGLGNWRPILIGG